MNHRYQHLVFTISFLSLMAILTTPVYAVVTPFTDFTAFQSSSGATAEALMPSTGSTTSEVVGGMTFTNHLPSTLNFNNWTSLLPGFELALNDVESYNIDFASPITGLGFDWVDVSDPQDTSFTINFYSGGAGGTNVGASTFTSNGVENTALFQGFTSTALFDRVQIREVGNDVQNEYFGQFYTGSGAVINTDDLTVTGDGDGDPSKAFGTPFTASISNGIARFKVAGDLNIGAGEQVRAIGSNGASLLVANDVNIDAGAILDFSGTGRVSGPGGGDGGDEFGTGSGGGNGGLPLGTGGIGGLGGFGGPPEIGGIVGTPGGAGANGIFGEIGAPDVSNGSSGDDGLNSSGSGAEPGKNDPLNGGVTVVGGLGGGAGEGGCNLAAIACIRGGGGGDGGGPGANGSPGEVGDGGDNGSVGSTGGRGHDGSGGLNTGGGSISGGGGGGSGSSGAGGGGGGSGGGGAGGGGGGGGGGSFFPFAGGGLGGGGGPGGLGGIGGVGGAGGQGGDGGGGGGAFEIIANGRVTVAGQLDASGADGTIGNLGDVGSNGSGGANGSAGVPAVVTPAGDGGAPGVGGKGGTGGKGGRGGQGGNGGGGAGGTVKIVGSVTETGSASVDTSGGAGAGDGRFIFGNNIVGGYTGTSQGGSQTNVGAPRDANPFVSGNPDTPFIPDLAGGAEVYGLTDLDADTDLAAVVNAAPANAVAALVYQDVGPTGFDDDYENFDMLLVTNLSDDPLTDVMFGAGTAGFETGLLQRGFAENPEFGGDGADALTELGAGEVYVTLVPDTTNNFQLSAMGISGSVASMSDGSVLYLVAGLPGDFDEDGDVDGSDFLAWQRGEVSDPPDASDLADWEANFGAAPSPLAAASTAVPEPSGLAFFAVGWLVLARNRRHPADTAII